MVVSHVPCDSLWQTDHLELRGRFDDEAPLDVALFSWPKRDVPCTLFQARVRGGRWLHLKHPHLDALMARHGKPILQLDALLDCRPIAKGDAIAERDAPHATLEQAPLVGIALDQLALHWHIVVYAQEERESSAFCRRIEPPAAQVRVLRRPRAEHV